MTYAEVRERSCNKNLESYTFLFFLCIHWKTFFCPSLFTQTKQKPMHRCEWRYYEETFQLFLSLSLSLDMLDMNSIQFHSGIKEKKSASKRFSRGEEQLRFFLNFLTLSCLKNDLLIVRNARIKK